MGGLDPALDDTEECLDWVEPRAVLCIEQNMHALGPCRLKNQAVVVDAGIVKKKHHAGPIEAAALPKAFEELLKEVLEHGGVDIAFYQLCPNYSFLSHSCDQTHRVVLRPGLGGGPDCECLRCKAVPPKTAGAPVAS